MSLLAAVNLMSNEVEVQPQPQVEVEQNPLPMWGHTSVAVIYP